jgi:hypothetical protein
VDINGNTHLQEPAEKDSERHEQKYSDGDKRKAQRLARGLGWFSIGLGLAEALAPRRVARISGISRRNTALIRWFGVREIVSGIAIFRQGDRPARAMWTRVVGDVLDLASMGLAFASPRTNRRKLGIATANVLAVSALDLRCARKLSGRKIRGETEAQAA